MSVISRCIRLALLWLAVAGLGWDVAAAEPVRRTVVALYDSAVEPTPADTAAHALAEMPLNHLGFVLRYHDLRGGLPSDREMEGVAALLLAVGYEVPGSDRMLRWLSREAEAGMRVVILGGFGASPTPGNRASIDRLLAPMGLRLGPGFVAVQPGARIATLDPDLVGFETPAPAIPPGHVPLRRRGTQAHVALEYEMSEPGRPASSIVVATGPGGGYAASGFFTVEDAALGDRRWILDPFAFFRAALGAPRFPVPDMTTVSGRRIATVQMDSDGWNLPVQTEDGAGETRTAAETALHDLVEPYPDLPFTIGLTTSDLDPAASAQAGAEATARRLLALPQVEPASQTATRPMRWGFFETDDADAERALAQRPEAGLPSRFAHLVSALAGGSAERGAATADGPRADANQPFDLRNEIDGALAKARTLSPDGKPVPLQLWTGDAEPFEAALRAAREAGLRNLNGGDARFDPRRASVSGLAPLSRSVGDERQIYAPLGSDDHFTEGWSSGFGAYRRIADVLQRTQEPRRLKGAHLRFHAYSASRSASVEAIRSLLDGLRSTPVAPIALSRYAAMADGFFSAHIWSDGQDVWRVEGRGGIETLRFDEADDKRIDPSRSTGILGETRVGRVLYVALDGAAPSARIALRPREPASGKALDTVLLTESRWVLSHLRRGARELAFQAQGFGPGEFRWSGWPAGRFTAQTQRGGAVLGTTRFTVAADGIARFSLDLDAREPLDVTIRPEDISVASRAGDTP